MASHVSIIAILVYIFFVCFLVRYVPIGHGEQSMHKIIWEEWLWGKKAKVGYLLFAATLLLFTLLSAKDMWTQEHRWADIVSAMFTRHDFLHPYLENNDYYDKPLLSYWLIAGLVAWTQHVSLWAMRVPSALAGLLAVWMIYRLGSQLKDKQLGLLSGWMLLTTFYFIFWAKTCSADMLNMAGSLLAVTWYAIHREHATFIHYFIFFAILAGTSLCKGLVGAVVPILVVLVDCCSQHSWRKHFSVGLLVAMLLAIVMYLLPFWASNFSNGDHYTQNGLSQVYRENILRYFHPFDHQDPMYAYFIYLPAYLFPWILFFIPALWYSFKNWQSLSSNSRWIIWSVLVLFIFFTFSGSRRNYYILPVVPFAILLTADGILRARWSAWASRVVMIFLLSWFLIFDILQPVYYSYYGIQKFVQRVQHQAIKIKPWPVWQVVLLDAESKISYYLQAPVSQTCMVQGLREAQTTVSLLQACPMLSHLPPNQILISRKRYQVLLQTLLKNYMVVTMQPTIFQKVSHEDNLEASVAFIPQKISL